jgi:hypothetical protein
MIDVVCARLLPTSPPAKLPLPVLRCHPIKLHVVTLCTGACARVHVCV